MSILPDEQQESLGHIRGRPPKWLEQPSVGGGRITPVMRETTQQFIIQSLAGPIAETKLTRRPNHAGASGDYEVVDNLLFWLEDERVAEPYAHYVEALARTLVDDYWYLIGALADDLLTRPNLSGLEVHRTLRRKIRDECDRLWPNNTSSGVKLTAQGWRDLANRVRIELREVS